MMTPSPASVVLVGFMGAGKSTVGRYLARRLGLCFVETDAMITAREGRPIPEIFAERGEAHFRRLEAEVLDELATKRGHVIATGGGFPCRPGAMERLRELGTVVWLAAEFEVVFARASRAGDRPMLAGRSPEEARALYLARQDHYRRAHLTIDTTHLSVDAVVNAIVRHVRERARSGRPARPAAAPVEGTRGPGG
jgi:shikimate kinase